MKTIFIGGFPNISGEYSFLSPAPFDHLSSLIHFMVLKYFFFQELHKNVDSVIDKGCQSLNVAGKKSYFQLNKFLMKANDNI